MKTPEGVALFGVFFGLRAPDDDHPEPWAAVRIDNPGGVECVMSTQTAAQFGRECIANAVAHPTEMFWPEVLALPKGTGVDAEGAITLGVEMITSAMRGDCHHAVDGLLRDRGWTGADRKRFLDDLCERTSL